MKDRMTFPTIALALVTFFISGNTYAGHESTEPASQKQEGKREEKNFARSGDNAMFCLQYAYLDNGCGSSDNACLMKYVNEDLARQEIEAGEKVFRRPFIVSGPVVREVNLVPVKGRTDLAKRSEGREFCFTISQKRQRERECK